MMVPFLMCMVALGVLGGVECRVVRQTKSNVETFQSVISWEDLLDVNSLRNGAIFEDDTTEIIELKGRELLKGCSGKECNICVDAHFFKVCLIAKYLEQNIGFEIDLTVNGHTVFHKEISVANPPKMCLNKIPWLPKLSDLCLEFYDVSLQNKSACARIVFEMKLGPLKKKFQVKLGCFKIPFAESEDDVYLTWMQDGGDLVAN